ncbi:MAG: DEAD/DEAH box helicase [Chloroflexi bacterium]|nr:DEAD/DEAH box helicase [Chloroflexota bacterium]
MSDPDAAPRTRRRTSTRAGAHAGTPVSARASTRARKVAPVLAPPVSEAIRRFAQRYPFPLDDFQLEALRALDAGRSVLAAAPTGIGKTVLAEFGIFLAREQGLRAIYTAPIKALSNQKFRDWRAEYGDAVGLLTGDVTENPTGSIVVMTTEVLRNMLLQTPHVLDDVGCVVFDEVHFLADPDRGTTWEEAILYCPKFVQLVCLSATVANADEIATWISHVHRETALVTHSTRAVPLEHYYYVDGELHLLVDAGGVAAEPLLVGGEARHQRPTGPARGARSARAKDVPRPRDVVQALEDAGMLPAIYFFFGRRACEIAAHDCLAHELISDSRSRRARRERIQAYLDVLATEDRQLEQVQKLVPLLHRGIAFHHAGLLPILKGLVEELFAAGLIGVVFATETLALGINMPARSVVIAEPLKYDGESRRPLLPNEYAQLVGRAGRRGLDPKGYAASLYSPWMSCSEVLSIITGDLLPIRSAFTPRYNTVAALWDGSAAARDRLVRLFASSLRQFQMNDALKLAAAEVEALRARSTALHYHCPYEGVPDDAIVEYSGLRRELSDARKRAQRATADAETLRRQLERPPWPAPSPDVVRREMQRFSGGEVVYVSGTRSADSAAGATGDAGAAATAGGSPAVSIDALRPGRWGVFLRRYGSGPGLILVGDTVEHVARWGDITRLPEGKPAVDLPRALAEVEGPVEDARALVGPNESRRLMASLERLGLPDLPGVEARRIAAAKQAFARHLEHARQRQGSAAEEVEALEASVRAHPCQACPIRSEHEHALRRERNALRALAEAERHEAELESAAASQAERTLTALTDVMARFGYLESRLGARPPVRRRTRTPLLGPRTDVEAGETVLRPTEKAAVLSRVYDPNGLLLLNLAWDGAFDHLAPAELMELLSWFSYDREGVRWNNHQLTSRLWDLRPLAGETLRVVQRAEAEADLAITTGPSPSFYGPVLAWCRGAMFAELLDNIALSEGDLLLTLNKTLDLATQIREALRTGAPESAVSRRLAPKLEVGDSLLRRGIVAQNLRLATNPPTESEA